MKISWVILTFNRAKTVIRAFEHNAANAGMTADELIWIDNGSREDQIAEMAGMFHGETDVAVFHKKNRGVAPGYNNGIILARSELVVITGCDRLMPENWMLRMKECFEKIPETGCLSCYSWPIERVPERWRNEHHELEKINEIVIQRAMPFEARMFKRAILKEAGHLREDLGLYGWEDCEHAVRFERAMQKMELISYTLPGFVSEHLGDEGVAEYRGFDEPDYHAFKKREVEDPKKQEILGQIAHEGNPYYSPFC